MDDPTTPVTRRGFLRAAGGAGVLAGASGRVAAQSGETHTVEMTDSLVFDPDELTIAPGDTVVWENVGTIGHSATAYEAELPGEATYFASGGFESEAAARDAYAAGDPASGDVGADATFEHRFDVEGTYDYFCIPHETAGMLGTIEVTEGGQAGGGDGSLVPTVPDAARSLALAATGTLLTVVGLAYFLLKYGGDYEGTGSEDAGR